MNNRIAILTPEFVLLHGTRGGLATYVENIATLLAERSYDVHVFVPGLQNALIDYRGLKVHTIEPHFTMRFVRRALMKLRFHRASGWLGMIENLIDAYRMRELIRKIETRFGSFDWIHGSDYGYPTLFITDDCRPILVRCSWARDAFEAIDGLGPKLSSKIQALLERYAIRRATIAYAPSEWVQNYYNNRFALDLRLIRPPLRFNCTPQSTRVRSIDRPTYFLFFGQLTWRKGFDYVLAAFELAHSRRPDMALMIAGTDTGGLLPKPESVGSGVTYLGPVDRDQLRGVISSALASVLPSRVDNLPNTAVESLCLGIPVITMRGSSIDELVVHGVNGWIVDQGDVVGLAQVLVAVWSNPPAFPSSLINLPVFDVMRPDVSVQQLLNLAHEGCQGIRARVR